MPRKPRMYLAGVPCHVVQRGNNRDTCFFADDDCQFYQEALGDACRRYPVDVHAYVLMTNHVHLLMTPHTIEGVSRVMQSLGRRYVQYINRAYRRCGTLWESRHKASLVDAEQYLLACYRYIELNPVAARVVKHPSDYRWSSFACNAWADATTLFVRMPCISRLPRTNRHASHAIANSSLVTYLRSRYTRSERPWISQFLWATSGFGNRSKGPSVGRSAKQGGDAHALGPRRNANN